eukprot:gb/GEZN01003336.1/.p3 GENE.gb/GEZN01003336.1/~~gb/GEZN01003336.1/.p3  ORF type:complete len:176 (+),score=60.16 gb/GEZN01003336.1/:892-1419(+)
MEAGDSATAGEISLEEEEEWGEGWVAVVVEEEAGVALGELRMDGHVPYLGFFNLREEEEEEVKVVVEEEVVTRDRLLGLFGIVIDIVSSFSSVLTVSEVEEELGEEGRKMKERNSPGEMGLGLGTEAEEEMRSGGEGKEVEEGREAREEAEADEEETPTTNKQKLNRRRKTSESS